MERYVCIHGHFYQPPRENPWLESIELQESAYPYHDWNERIAAECYAPNATSRILDVEGRIAKIVNNYARISFNFGPTLLSWMERATPEIYQAVLQADRESQERFSGHGSALAQVYNHMILPLANRRDRMTQIAWGLRDFEHRFKRKPEGMWLPETAVDLETLDLLAEGGIHFTILAPHQARRVRPLGGRAWKDVAGGKIDPSRAYEQQLPSGRKIALFFYDGPVSRAVAFERLLASGEKFAQRLTGAFLESRGRAQLVHIAADGETYGHHHRHGDMALAYALATIDADPQVKITNYGEYLEKHPPTHQVEILEKSSWSCVHGIDRWWSDCGCDSGKHPDWNQAWRMPLRDALDFLRDTLSHRYEERAAALFKDPWGARDAYIGVVLDRSRQNMDRFLSEQAHRPLAPEEQVLALKLLELQRFCLLMYTSCGWFFDELSGIETVQVIQYAGRAIQLAQETLGEDRLEATFLGRLEKAQSNLPEHRDGRFVYEKFVRPAMVNMEKVAAHYGISSLFETYPEATQIHCYHAHRLDQRQAASGRARLALGKVRFHSVITQESKQMAFGVLHLGDHHLQGGVRVSPSEEEYQAATREVTEAFGQADFPQVIRLFDKHFGGSTYTLRSLFRDEQRKILDQLLASSLAEAEAAYRRLYEDRAALIRFLANLGIPAPRAFTTAAEFFLNGSLRRALEEKELDLDRIEGWLKEARELGIALDRRGLGYALGKSLERMTGRLLEGSEQMEPAQQLELLEQLERTAVLVGSLFTETDLWKSQNQYYELFQKVYPQIHARAQSQDATARQWCEHFSRLGEALRIRI